MLQPFRHLPRAKPLLANTATRRIAVTAGLSGSFLASTSSLPPLGGTSTFVNHRARASQTANEIRRVGMERGLVSCEWLREELDKESSDAHPICIVDATWYLPNSPFAAPEGSQGALAEYISGPRLPGAVFFDIDGVATPHLAGVPHMLPDEERFATAMAELGITHSTPVVVYDRHGIFSAPRFWYTLKVAFGHPAEVAVLDGGLPRWKELGFPLEDAVASGSTKTGPKDEWQRVAGTSWTLEEVKGNIDSQEALIVDARPAGRFLGTVPEPRAGMRGGHMPGSINVPFINLLTAPPRMLRPPEELRTQLQSAGVQLDQLEANAGTSVVTSCGSGLTACVVGLAMHQLGLPLEKWAVYDGSWAEWGARQDTRIVRQAADGTEESVP
mmetsp:Transcript_126550/g.252959  ORF Transcript_126550/g.252959 Transcript_126550/m.252959 type:complete len:386 (-) Transcript_126550:28-1185(-)